MLRFNDDFDYYDEFINKWNKKIHSLRIIGIVIGAAMIIGAILCMFYPIRSVKLMGTVGAILILILGIYQLVDYLAASSLFRWNGSLISAVCNLIIGFLLLYSPIEMTINTFAFILGFILMIYGINKLTFAHQLSFFNVEGYGWVVFTGILNILAAFAFIISPMVSTIVLNYIVAIYLLIGGIALLIEVINMDDLKI